MPYVPLPARPTYRQSRWDNWGDAVADNVAQLIQDVPELATKVNALNAGGGTGFTQWPIITPASATTWPTITRVAGDGPYVWARNWTADVLAPLPTAANGVRDRDLILPVAVTESVAATAGVLWSDSLTIPGNALLDGRFGDHAQGGADPAWTADLSTTANSGGRARLMPNVGAELYSNVYGVVTAPKIPTTGGLKTSWRFGALAANNALRLLLRGATYNAADAVWLELKSSGPAVNVTVLDGSSGTLVSTPLGSASYTAGASAATLFSVTVTGQNQVVVDAGGTKLTQHTIPANAARGTAWAMYTPWYNSATVKDVKVETL